MEAEAELANTILQNAADFLADIQYANLDPEIVVLSKQAIVDYIGCSIAGSRETVVDKTYRWACGRSHGEAASVFCRETTLDAEHAAMLNAVAGHALDFDDSSWTTIGHPTTVAAPVAIALAEQHGATGEDVLTAYAAGVEVGHKIAQMTMPDTSVAGWHTTAVYGVIIAAAVQSCMLNLDRETICHGLGIALSRAGGLRSNFGTMTKPLHAGLAVKSGMEAMALAQVGITASPLAFEATDGFLNCFAGKSSVHGLCFGDNWDLTENGLAFKLYPCCSGSHPAADLMVELVGNGMVSADQVKSIHVGTSLLGPRELVSSSPQSPTEAKFSMQFVLAAILIRGELTLDEFTEEFVCCPEIQGLMERISMDIDSDLATLGFIGTAPVKMEITLNNGKVLHVHNNVARGNPEKPFETSDFVTKFMNNAVRSIAEDRAKVMLKQLFRLEYITDIKGLMGLTR
jgi:2-methylcitrate dehydratase PrpD